MSALVLAWGALVWINWFAANPVHPDRAWRALVAWGEIRPGPALRALAGHAGPLALAGLFALAAGGAGRGAGAWAGAAGTLERIACGAGVMSFAVLGIGFCGLAFGPLGWMLLAACAAPVFQRGSGPWRGVLPAWPSADHVPVAALGALLASALGLGLVSAWAPEGSYDALFHHLAHPQLFADRHKVFGLPRHFLSHYPALLESQYLLAFLAGGGACLAKLLHFGYGLLTLAALWTWARKSLEPRWALAACAAFALLPYVQLVQAWAYVDFGFAFLFTLAARRMAAPAASPAFLGALCGLCAGTKATGMFAAVLAGAALARRRAAPVPFALGFLALAAPWGVRNWLVAGNPFAPFLAGWLPTLWWGPGNQARYGEELRSYERASGLAGLFAAPWNASVRNAGVLDRGGGMGGWFLFALPLLAVAGGAAAVLPGRAALGFFALWLLIPRQVRYLLPAWPAAALAAALVVRDLARRGGPGTFVAGVLGVVLALHLPAALERQREAQDPVRVAFGLETARDYLDRGLPGRPHSLAMRDWIRDRRPGGRFLIVSDYGLGMLWGPDAVFQSVFDTPLIERAAREAAGEARIAVRLRQEGVRSVLYGLTGGFSMQSVYRMYAFDDGAAERWRAFWSAHARLVHAESEKYQLFDVTGPPRDKPIASVLPGLDEQWLGDLDRAVYEARTLGEAPARMREFAEGFRRVAERTNSPCAWEYLGGALLELNDEAGARAALERARALGRDTAAVHAALAAVAARAHDWGAATRELKAALARDPALASARAQLARMLAQLGREREARELVREGLALDPLDPGLGELWGTLTGTAGPP